MRRQILARYVATLVIILSLGLTAQTTSLAQSGVPEPETLSGAFVPLKVPPRLTLESFERRVDDALEDRLSAALVFVVIDDGKVAFSKGYGYADLEAKTAATSQTVFPLG